MGFQIMLVPLGCPYDAAARVLKGRDLSASLPESALFAARKDPAVALAAPFLTSALPRPKENRTDQWVGIDEAGRLVKPWWKAASGNEWFSSAESVILGAGAAELEMRRPGDPLYSPELKRTFRVAGILEPSGTSDDSLFFVPLSTAQSMFKQEGRLTAVAIRLKDPSRIRSASERLQAIPGAQVVTLAEMMGTFLNLIGSARAVLLAIAGVAIAVGSLGVFNTMMAAALERMRELAVLRALGCTPVFLFGSVSIEALLLSGAGAVCGLFMALAGGDLLERAVLPLLPLAPISGLASLTLEVAAICTLLALSLGFLAGLVPAITASRIHPAEALRWGES